MIKNIVLVAAIAENGVIGNDGKIPWHISEDKKRFRELTLNSPIIMGRKTFDSIGKSLDNRLNIILTRNKELNIDGVLFCHSIAEALDSCKDFDSVFVIGGQEIYEQTINIASSLEITFVHEKFEGDKFFPEIGSSWKENNRIKKEGYSFVSFFRA